MQIKPLQWKKLDFWIAKSPASPNGYLSIALEQGKYWPLWACDLPGYDTLGRAMEQAQLYHNKYVEDFISQYTC